MGDLEGTVVLFSGGMDSTVLAYYARYWWGDPVHLLSCEYGQRHLYELDVARKLAHDFVPASHKNVAIGPKGVGLRSMLLQPKGDVTENGSVVPARNLWFLIAGAVHAQALGLSRVAIGCNNDDQATYRDCRDETIQAQAHACRLALDWPGSFEAPFVGHSKKMIADVAREIGCEGPMRRSWSCYQPVLSGENWGDFTPCETCPACVKRRAALDG